MDNDRLQRILTIVDTTLSLEAEKRPEYLTEVCGDDETLKKEVQKLLASIDQSEAFWEGWQEWNNRQIQQLFDEPKEQTVLPDGIGPWKPVALLGRGGMGTVYLAQRADGLYKQRAAVKLLQRGLEQGETIRRFEQERQILATLDHPHIAGFYDGGLTFDGRPWLAIQYVDGVSITNWCRENDADLKERLRLFENVCEAVRYAHKNLIVHRDLKPDNILVDRQRHVKILDFGIAKLLDDQLSETQRIQTQTGLRVMSLDYAAPEQITGEPITTATDVYALGLLLYELLTDTYPFDLENKNQRQAEQILRNQDPAMPSSASTEWQAELRGDLDAITLKALRKEPEQRYENAGQLLDDIKKYHSNLPVSARSDTARYQMGKFYKRHRVKLVTAITVVAVISSLITYYTLRVTSERNIARQEAAKAAEVSSFLEDLFNASDPFVAAETDRPDTMNIRLFLERGAAKLQKELADQPAVQARMLTVVGDVYINLGLFDEALTLLKQALIIGRKAGAPADLAATLESKALAHQRKGAYAIAEQHYREALVLRRGEQGEQHEMTARTKFRMGTLLRTKSAYEESETLLRQALATQESLLGGNDTQAAVTLRELGILFQHQGDLDRAEYYLRKSLVRYKNLKGDTSLDVAQSTLSLAPVLREKGNYTAAESLMREGLEIQRNALGEAHPFVVSTLFELAILLRDKPKPEIDEAVDLFRKIIDLDRKQLGKAHHYVGRDFVELGIAFNKLEMFDEATQAYRQSLNTLRKALPEGHTDIALSLNGLGYTLARKGNAAEAEPFLREGLQIRLNKLGADAWRTGVSKSTLGWATMLQRRYDEAEPLLLQGYHSLRDSDGPVGAALKRLIELYEKKEQPKQAAIYRRLLEEARY